jgi:geranylgeranyl diphosphate synthase, type II
MSHSFVKLRTVENSDWIPVLNRTLEENLATYPHRTRELLEAALYSVSSPGHRWRPILLLKIYENVARERSPYDVLSFACAIEYLHTASIIMDDLPAMDDATLRRSKQPCHLKFGQPRAILTAHWLCDVAQHLIHEFDLRDYPRCTTDLEDLLRTTKNEMMRGQTLDLEGKNLSDEEIIEKYRLKSGALYGFTASVPAHLSGLAEAALHLERFGNYLGIAYQISDDIHDMTDNIGALGKDVRKDEHRGSIPYLHGIDKAIKMKDLYMGKCVGELKASGGPIDDIVELVEKICF